MKIGEQRIDTFKTVTGIDEELCECRFCPYHPLFIRDRFENSRRGSAHGDNPLCIIYYPGGFFPYLKELFLNHMFFHDIPFERKKCPIADMEGDGGNFNSLALQAIKNILRKM